MFVGYGVQHTVSIIDLDLVINKKLRKLYNERISNNTEID